MVLHRVKWMRLQRRPTSRHWTKAFLRKRLSYGPGMRLRKRLARNLVLGVRVERAMTSSKVARAMTALHHGRRRFSSKH
jgi:hypothetical protein